MTSTDCTVKSKPQYTGPQKPAMEVADIFKLYGDEYRRTHKLSSKQKQVMHAIEHCQDGEFGYHVDVCDHCAHTVALNNSCRDRHCPKCNNMSRQKWVKKRLEDILPIPYYHAVFTLPHVLFPFSLFNIQVILKLLFECASGTLEEFAADPKWLGAKIGFYGVLHTWGGKLWQHLHAHFIVTGGGLNGDGEWVDLKYKGKFLFPVHGLSKTFRKKFINGLKKAHSKGQLNFPDDMKELESYHAFDQWIHHTFPKKWVVFAKSPFAGPEKVVKYLGLYSHRVAISNYRLIGIIDDRVHFHYKYHDKKKNKVCWDTTSLAPMEFIRRFLMHVLPSGFHRVRHFGLFTNGVCKKNVEKIRKLLLPEDTEDGNETKSEDDCSGKRCPRCINGRMITTYMVINKATIILSLSSFFSYISKVCNDTS